MAAALNWGILAAGNIARSFTHGLQRSKTGKLLAIASRSQEKANAFAAEFNVPRAYGSYDALLADPDVQVVYIATPHPQHAEWVIKTANARKHILCEKPLAVNYAQAMTMIEAAKANDVFLMEAFMYRCHPQTAKVVELIRSREIGDVRMIHATFSFHAPFNPDHRLFNNDLAGGGILDVGCYCASMARLIAGVATGKDFADPTEVKAVGHLGACQTDEWSAAVLRFPGDILAQLSTGIAVDQDNIVRIYGSEGSIEVPSPWAPAKEGGSSTLVVRRKDQPPQTITIQTPDHLYAIEVDTVAANLEKRQAPAMTWDDTLDNMRTLDLWRQSFGFLYNQEKSPKPPTSSRPAIG